MTSETAKVRKGKASAKRNSEARREQNRLASRNYREKRKQKLALLNEILEPIIGPNGAESTHFDSPLGQNGLGDINTPQLQDQPLSNIPLDNPVTSIDLGSGLSGLHDTAKYNSQQTWGGLAQTTTPISIFNSVFPASLPLTNLENPFSFGNSDPWGYEAFGPSQQLLQFAGTHEFSPGSQSSIEEVFDDSLERGCNLSQASSSDEDSAVNDVLSGVENLSIEQKRSLLRRLQEDTQEPISSHHPQKYLHQTPGQRQAIEFAKALYKTAHARPSLLPTQCTMEAGIFGAIFANCYALGMPGVDEIIREEGCSVFSVTPDEGYHPSQLPLLKQSFQTLSSDLQPIDKQLTFGHHPYVDVIPFKSFRENLITVLDRDPSLIDEGVLCHDILAGGFTCWGTGRNVQGMSASVPWDSRSWEPSVWFLIKYRIIVGDWNGSEIPRKYRDTSKTVKDIPGH
ncbi:hypothetical protein FHETE_9724 [Fusarium heterosporum]|uniref:BZIP domain-containing protein n=1 Tax=Fusarium heterosporum TaxID=42747 RepID=A0A8H5SW61_FUSHE|nr:hypothetical protein FHETE_9724 [Fusarium heterosporum]